MKIGMLVGMENTFPPALIEKINEIDRRVEAELVKIGGVTVGQPNDYVLIFDRISHEIPFYRSFLKNAVLNGTIVVNNPFWCSADEKFFGYSLARKLGLRVPKTVLLPQKSYKQGVTDASLRNLEFPLNWEAVIEYVGMPAILKPHEGGGWKDVYKVNTKEELWSSYDRTGTLVMVLQEFIDFSAYLRCFCVGRRDVLIMPYDPVNRRYLPRELNPLDQELEDRIVRDTILINEALGYDLNAVEFAIKDSVPYAIDVTNPIPDADLWSVTEPYFNWVTNAVAKLLVDYVINGVPTLRYHRWNRWLTDQNATSLPASGELGPSGGRESLKPKRTTRTSTKGAKSSKTTRTTKALKSALKSAKEEERSQNVRKTRKTRKI